MLIIKNILWIFVYLVEIKQVKKIKNAIRNLITKGSRAIYTHKKENATGKKEFSNNSVTFE